MVYESFEDTVEAFAEAVIRVRDLVDIREPNGIQERQGQSLLGCADDILLGSRKLIDMRCDLGELIRDGTGIRFVRDEKVKHGGRLEGRHIS